MANGIGPDFRAQPTQDVGAIARLLLQKKQIEENMRQNRIQNQRNMFADILAAVQAGQQIASNAVTLSQKKQVMKGQIDTARILKEGPIITPEAATRPVAPPIQQFGRTEGPPTAEGVRPPLAPTGTVQPRFVDTQEGRGLAEREVQRVETREGRLQESLFRADPQTFMKKLIQGEESGGGIPQKINMKMPDGSVELGYFDPQKKGFFFGDGRQAPPGTRQAFSEGASIRFFTDPIDKRRYMIDLISGVKTLLSGPKGIELRGYEDLTLDEKERFDKHVERYTKDPVRVGAETSLQQVGHLKEVLNTGVGFATEPLKSLVARIIAGEKGVLTDKDVARNSGNQALIPKFTQLLVKWSSGELTAVNRKELNVIIKAIEKNSRQKLAGRVASHRGAISKNWRMAPEEVEKMHLLPTYKFSTGGDFISKDEQKKKKEDIRKKLGLVK